MKCLLSRFCSGCYLCISSPNPHELASWVNKMVSYTRPPQNAHGPHELASWVKKMVSYTRPPQNAHGPHELASWVKKMVSYTCTASAPPRNKKSVYGPVTGRR